MITIQLTIETKYQYIVIHKTPYLTITTELITDPDGYGITKDITFLSGLQHNYKFNKFFRRDYEANFRN